jgi:ribosomal protein S12 methylthiotransferase accessory factor
MSSKITMSDAFKKFTLDQDKIFTPEETVKRFKEKTETLKIDILEKTMRIDNGRLDIPVFFSICGQDARQMTGTNKQMGKGATPSQAEASAVMELAERFSFFSFCNTPDNFITDTYGNLKDRALPFEMIAKSVHDESDDFQASKTVFENLPLQWTRGYNLTRQEEILVPFTWFYAINEFNGPSAGNCTEEALSQGICEIVERHTSSIISRGKLNVPAINPESATDPMVVEMLEKYEKAGIKLFLSDFSLDTGIPSVGVMAYDPTTFPQKSEIVWTAGTTPDPEKALSRALTEVAQLAGDFDTGSNYVASGLPKFTKLAQATFITNPQKVIDISNLPNLSNNNIRIEVEQCIEALSRNSMEVISINTMHPHLEIPAFYTIIPGAHFRERAHGTSVGMFAAKIITETYSPGKAIQELMKFETHLPNRYYLKFYMGTSTLSAGAPEQALDFFQHALDLNPTQQDIPSIYSYMGGCLKDMEKYEQALEALSKGEKLDQERTDIYNLMGFCNFKLKKHEEAIECFKKVLELDPSSAIDYANIASNYRDMGNTEKAIQYYSLALELDASIQFAEENLKKLSGSLK